MVSHVEKNSGNSGWKTSFREACFGEGSESVRGNARGARTRRCGIRENGAGTARGSRRAPEPMDRLHGQ
jgi:hypothetical protein